MRVLAFGGLFLATLAFASSSLVQVYLHPTPPLSPHSSVPTLSAAQAKAVLSHHLGTPIGDFDELPADETLWSHLVGMWEGQKEEQRARVVVIEGGVDAQDVLPTGLAYEPAFYLEEGSPTRALLAPYLQRASVFLSELVDYLPSVAKGFKDAFDMAGTKAAAALSNELSALTALADSIPWLDNLKHSAPWEAISISGLSHVDKNDEAWEAGRSGVKAGLEAMTQPGSPPLLLIIVPSKSSRLVSRSATMSRRAGNTTLATVCYPSNSTCSDDTSCFGRGICALKSNSSGSECWGCKCASGYAGVECQKDDYSVPFVIIVFSTILLVGMLVGSVALLWTVGDTKLPSTLNLAVGGHMKRD